MARLVASVGAVVPVAAAATARVNVSAMATAPVVWDFLGYPFEAAGMIAGLFGCFAARFWIGAGQQLRKEHRWSLDVPVSGMALALTAVLILWQRPAPFGGLMLGAGAGVLGEGAFKIAERYLAKAMAVLGDADPSAETPAPVPAPTPAPAQPLKASGPVQTALRKAYPPRPLPDDLAALSKRLDPTAD